MIDRKDRVRRAQRLYREGWRTTEIARIVHVNQSTAHEWCRGLEVISVRFRVLWDEDDGCWRIWERDEGWVRGESWLEYTCLLWMRFGSQEAAEGYLGLHELPVHGVAA